MPVVVVHAAKGGESRRFSNLGSGRQFCNSLNVKPFAKTSSTIESCVFLVNLFNFNSCYSGFQIFDLNCPLAGVIFWSGI